MSALSFSLTSRAALVCAVLICLAGPAFAQTVERDLQIVPVRQSAVIAPPNLDAVVADETPIEGPLTAVLFLSETDAVLPPGEIAPGVDTQRVAPIDDDAFRQTLADYLGKPVSLRLIAEIEAETANWYRAKGMPFISVFTPEQEITGGVLQFRVTEFRLGDKVAEAPGRLAPNAVLGGIRVNTGDTINSDLLAEDLNWLSRSPFREVSADFAPGAELFATDMTVRVVETKPFAVTAGYDNTGARSTGSDRFRTSLTLGDLPVPGSILSYQLALSPDCLENGIAPFGGHAAYQSHTANAFVPTLPRQALEATFSVIESNAEKYPFDVRSDIAEARLGYRLLASELGLPPGWGELVAGVEFRRGVSQTRFSGTLIAETAAEIAQVFAGWSNTIADDGGHTALGVELHLSPGGLTSDNSDVAFSDYSATRVDSARYGYLDLELARRTHLPFDLSLDNELSVRLATGPLIGTEQMSLGGNAAVRGYLPDDGAFDAGAVLRNTLRLPPLRWHGAVTPFVLADFGMGGDLSNGDATLFASIGAGAEFSLAGQFDGTLSAAMALTDREATKAGDVNVSVQIGGRY